MFNDPTIGPLIQLVIALGMAFIAFNKGFKPWNWLLACGLIGLLALLLQPSAKEVGLDHETRLQRRRKGNRLGALLSLVTVAGILIIVIFNITK